MNRTINSAVKCVFVVKNQLQTQSFLKAHFLLRRLKTNIKFTLIREYNVHTFTVKKTLAKSFRKDIKFILFSKGHRLSFYRLFIKIESFASL